MPFPDLIEPDNGILPLIGPLLAQCRHYERDVLKRTSI